MKVLIIAKEDYLGAGKAAFRLYESFKRKGHEVCMLVKNKVGDDKGIIKYDDLIKSSYYFRVKQFLENRVFKFSKRNIVTDHNYYFFGSEDLEQNPQINLIVNKLPFNPQIIIVTWTSDFFSPKSLFKLQRKTGARMFVYPMDMSLLTGGCHYAWDCVGYTANCKNCPAILEKSDKDIAFRNLESKKKYYKKAGINALLPSEQLLNQAKESSLFKNQKGFKNVLIPIEENTYNSRSREEARSYYKLSTDLKVIFFGASFTNEKRKGLSLLVQAMNLLKDRYIKEDIDINSIRLLIAGNRPDANTIVEFPFNTTYLGYITDDKIFSLAYQAADVFINTSIQDSGPMMINESIMCGTPVVTFDLGVAPDLVLNDFSGYRVQIKDVEKMSNALYNILEKKVSFDRSSISEFGYQKTSYASFDADVFINN